MLHTPAIPLRIRDYVGQALASAALGVLLAFLGLNWASGCGQGGACITPADLMTPAVGVQIAQAR